MSIAPPEVPDLLSATPHTEMLSGYLSDLSSEGLVASWGIGLGLGGLTIRVASTISVSEFVQVAIGPSQASPRRARELSWLYVNRDALHRYAGEWIAVEREQIIAFGKDLASVVAEARRQGVRVPFIHRVEPGRSEDVIEIGL